MRKTRVNYRRIYENYNNVCILPGMHIHHIDGNSDNNHPINLLICTPEEHWVIHRDQGDIRCLNGKFIQGASAAGKLGGKAGVGWHYTPDGSKRLSEALILSYVRRGGSSLKGTVISEERRLNMSIAQSGEKNVMFNKKHTEESKKKMSEKKLGRVSVPAGWKHTEETKRKLSDRRKEHFLNGGYNGASRDWDIFDENGNMLFASMKNLDIMKQYNLNERSYKSLIAFMRRNNFTKSHHKLKILIKGSSHD